MTEYTYSVLHCTGKIRHWMQDRSFSSWSFISENTPPLMDYISHEVTCTNLNIMPPLPLVAHVGYAQCNNMALWLPFLYKPFLLLLLHVYIDICELNEKNLLLNYSSTFI